MSHLDCNIEQIARIYHIDYIQYALRPLILSGILEIKFISIKYLLPDCLNMGDNIWKQNLDNPYINHYQKKEDIFARDIVSRGMYFPLYIYPIENTEYYYVYEGRHRISSLRMLMDNGELSPDYKVLCVITPSIIYNCSEQYTSIKLLKPLNYRYLYPDSTISTISFNRLGSLLVNKYTVQYTAWYAWELINTTINYQEYLSHRFYEY